MMPAAPSHEGIYWPNTTLRDIRTDDAWVDEGPDAAIGDRVLFDFSSRILYVPSPSLTR
jgi:hypothetical protein